VFLADLLAPALPIAAAADATAARPILAEVPDDAPATRRPRDELRARSPGMRLAVGSYESVQVNVDALGQNIVGDAGNEPSIAVNPLNPNNIVVGWRQFDTIDSNFRQAGWSYSMDGGQSWTFPGSLTPGTFRSDPVLDSDSDGNFYYQSLTSGFLLDVFRSEDGGVSWGAPIASFGGDKNWMVIDKSGSIGNGHIYGIWREPFGCCGPDVLTRSTNGGTSYEPPLRVVRSPGIGTMAVGPEGELYLTGVDEVGGSFADFVAVRSLDARDAGQTPTFADADVDLRGAMVIGATPNPGGLLGQANIAVDTTDSPTRGFLYVMAAVRPDPDFGQQPSAVHFSRSEDGGVRWTSPSVVNDDPPTNGAWHWMAAHSVAPNGRIDAIWNDTRNTGSDSFSRLHYAYSHDQGRHWSANVAVSSRFDSTVGWPNQNKIGDYSTIVSDLSGAHVAYAATFNGEQDVYHLRVFPDCNDNGISDVDDVGFGAPDCNANLIPDSCEPSMVCGPAGALPTGSVSGSDPLLLAKSATPELSLSWGTSCLATDGNYAIYEGSIGGDFTSHTRKICGTAGNTTEPVLPDPGDRYYLVVPLSADREGSYGRNGAGEERPAGLSVCAPQSLGSCPPN